ncbi:Uncharacterized protein BP5553_00390 [Venustampulla echinocandica]|uniref:Uncharacterized protein n=1 Tax=Venustampulla echinocandica TaxID=2656787 RepID=A0A370TY20_9HELO|nr:Uncharacterized protein BP5553_00390 [Venustampulla echinocandica]RDL40411.1 Uncharacterized protein BP5553_00390 [Venustampulla echinocandica]
MSSNQVQHSDFEDFDAHNAGHQRRAPVSGPAESVRLGLTTLALLSAIVIVGTAGDTLATFNSTHLGDEYMLPLWPKDFDLRPTTALVVCGAIITITSAVSLAVSVSLARNKPLIQSSVAFLAPGVCLIAGLIGTSFFYGVNSSNTVSSIQSWSCQWSSIPMDAKPHWGTLCKESKAALYLMVMMIPLQVLVLGAAALGAVSQTKQPVVVERKGSPAMS